MIVGKVWPPIPPHTKLSHGSCTYSYNKTAYLLIICIVFSASKSLLPSKIFWLVYLQSGNGLADSNKSRNRSRSRKQKAESSSRSKRPSSSTARWELAQQCFLCFCVSHYWHVFMFLISSTKYETR